MRNPRTAADWDDDWTAGLADEWTRRHSSCRERSALLQALTNLGDAWVGHSVLVIGCGISTEPAALAHAGYDVVALDLSRVAVAHVIEHPATPQQLATWFGLGHDIDLTAVHDAASFAEAVQRQRNPDPAEVHRVLDAHRRAGGSLVTLCQDFRAFETDRRFDIVYIPYTWHCLEAKIQTQLARRAFAWLVPGGICSLMTIGIQGEFLETLHREFAAAGFFEGNVLRYFRHDLMPPDNLRERFEHDLEQWRDNTRRAVARLAAGEKMYELRNGR